MYIATGYLSGTGIRGSYLETAYVSGSLGKMYGDVRTYACLFPRSHWHVLHVSLPVSRLVTCNSNVVLLHRNLLSNDHYMLCNQIVYVLDTLKLV